MVPRRKGRVQRFSRWIVNDNDNVTFTPYFLPIAAKLLRSLAEQTLLLVLKGSEVSRGCLTLMVSVVH